MSDVKHLFLWPTSIPEDLAALLTRTFTDVNDLIDYVYKVLKDTDAFHLIIPVNDFKALRSKCIHRFPQTEHIDVIADNLSDDFAFGKIQLCQLKNIHKIWERIICDNRFTVSAELDRKVKDAIVTLIETRIQAKSRVRRSDIEEHGPCTSLYGLPVHNTHVNSSCLLCPSCKLMYLPPYKLVCEHQLCLACLKTQERCPTCLLKISPDEFVLDQNLKLEMENSSLACFHCQTELPMSNYESHLKETHKEQLTHFIETLSESNETSQPPIISQNGSCIWEIRDADKKKGVNGSIYSAPFYLYPNGYKMCLRLYPTGDNKRRNTHMSIFFVLMSDDNNDHLQWPFRFPVSFTLINQSNPGHYDSSTHQVCWPDSNSDCLKCPRFGMNVAFGIPCFTSLDLLKQNPNLFRPNNTMYIKFQIDFAAPMPDALMPKNIGEMPDEDEHVEEADDDISGSICCFNNFPVSK